MGSLTAAERATVRYARAYQAAGRVAGPVLTGELLAIIERLTTPGKPGPRKGYRWAASKVKPCGTEAAYRRHLYRKEESCPACREAAARAATARKRAREGRAP